MIRYQDLQILDYVLINGKIRRVEAITKRKVGYHIHPTDQLHYARLQDVFPVKIKELKLETKTSRLVISEDVYIDVDIKKLSICEWNHTIMIKNFFDEGLILREWHLHLLQHIFKALDIKYTINVKKNLEL